MHITVEQLVQTITPLLLALHEKGVLDIAEVPHYFEDIAQRRIERQGATDADLEFQRQMAAGIGRLAVALKIEEQFRPS